MAERSAVVTVLWCDFGGVLTPPVSTAMDSVADASGVPWPVLERAIEEVAAESHLTGLGPLELGRTSQAEWGAAVTARLPARHRSRIDLGRWGEYWYRGRVPETRMLAQLERAASAGLRLGLLTNSVLEWEPFRGPLLGDLRFDAVIRSHEIGIAKPDPRIYALADALLPPGRGAALLIDDSEANCAAAEAHGWHTILHTDATGTITELDSLVRHRSA